MRCGKPPPPLLCACDEACTARTKLVAESVEQKLTTGLTEVIHDSNTTSDNPSTRVIAPQDFPASLNSARREGLEKILEREYCYGTTTWPTTATRGTTLLSLAFPGFLAWNNYMMQRLTAFEGFRADLELTFRIVGTPYHFGLCVAYVDVVPNDLQRSFNTDFFPWYQHVLLSANSQEPMTLTIPYYSRKEFLKPPTVIEDKELAEIKLDVLCPLSATMDTVPPVEIQVFYRLKNVQLFLPVEYHADIRPAEEGLLTRVTRVASEITGALRKVPIIGSTSGIISDATGSLSKIFHRLNWDKPYYASAVIASRETNADWCATDGSDTAVPLAHTRDPRVATDKEVTGASYGFRHLSELLCRPYVVDIVTVTNYTPYTPIMVANVNLGYSNSIRWTGTNPCARLLRFYNLWRGSMRYMVYVSASAYTTVRLRVTWTMRNSGTFQGGEEPSIVTECRGDSFIKFSVPYLHQKGALTFGEGLGNIVISADAVTTPSATDSFYVLLFASAGEDIELFQPVQYHCDVLKQFTTRFDSILPHAETVVQERVLHPKRYSDVTEYAKIPFKTVQTNSSITLAGPTGDASEYLRMFKHYRGSMVLLVYTGDSIQVQSRVGSDGYFSYIVPALTRAEKFVIPYESVYRMEVIGSTSATRYVSTLLTTTPTTLAVLAGDDFQVSCLVPPV